MADDQVSKANTRSVDNLQRLYTVVVSLAVTESLRRLFLGTGTLFSPPSYESSLMFASLIFTVVPFYHGANRYLDATYVTGERKAKPQALMLDFVILFVEALLFFGLALLTNNQPAFYTVLAILFLLDIIWVGLTNVTAHSESDKFPRYTKWAIINFIAFALLLLFTWSNILNWPIWKNEVATNISLLIVVVARTVIDYILVWPFYYPGEGSSSESAYSGIPAPPPGVPPDLTRQPSNVKEEGAN
jgi:hypothetical protein